MIRKTVAEILDHHVTFELEAIDRMYLNGYVPSLQTGGGVVYFMKQYLGARVPSTMMVAPLTKRFVDAMERFAETAGVDLVTFAKDQRKDDVAQQYLAAFTEDEGVLFIGKAQEKASVFRTEKRRNADGRPIRGSSGRRCPSITTMSTPSTWTLVRSSSSLLLLSLRDEGLSERARVAQTPAHAARHPLRTARQRHPVQ